MESLLPVFKQLWVVWLIILFAGIVVWVYWPGRRRQMEDNARIPFRDEEGKNGGQR